MSVKLLVRRKNGNPRTGSSRPPEGVARATNSMAPACAEVRGAAVAVATNSRIVTTHAFFITLILAEQYWSRYELVQMVNTCGGLAFCACERSLRQIANMKGLRALVCEKAQV